MSEQEPEAVDVEAIAKDAVAHSNQTGRRLRALVVILGLLAAAGAAVGIYGITSDKNDAEAGEKQAKSDTRELAVPAEQLANDVLRVCRAGGKEAKALREAGLCVKAGETKETVEEKTNTPVTDDRTRPPTPYIWLTEEQLGPFARDYFNRYCAVGNRCQGKDGEDAPPVSEELVAAQVANQLPGLLGAQLPAALSANCGGSCKSDVPGPKGDTGDKGEKGDPADPAPVAVASFTCSGGLSPVTYTVFYTDGTTKEFTCGELPPVDPPTDPAPAE